MTTQTYLDPKTIDAGFLAACLLRAMEAAVNKSNTPDGGSCCLDTPVLHLVGVPRKVIAEAQALSGIKLGEPMSGFWRGYRFVWTPTEGQADRRSAMSQAAYESLRNDGLRASHWQQMD